MRQGVTVIPEPCKRMYHYRCCPINRKIFPVGSFAQFLYSSSPSLGTRGANPQLTAQYLYTYLSAMLNFMAFPHLLCNTFWMLGLLHFQISQEGPREMGTTPRVHLTTVKPGHFHMEKISQWDLLSPILQLNWLKLSARIEVLGFLY